MIHNPGLRTLKVALSACALVAAAALTPLRPALEVGSAKGLPAQAWTVLAPVSYKNLTIFPIRSREAATDAYITLDEGTKRGTVVIAEKGSVRAARGPVRRGESNAASRLVQSNAASRTVQQAVSYDGGASVNELALVNRSGKKLLLLAGE
ncbi:MAG: hypothetical protein QOJ76_1522, partial [Acidobacteriota bacterium]|nr:hypothetical protein [Acidobacteriota bacterium]